MDETPTVIFLHGLARSSRSLLKLRRLVEKAGFDTWAKSYPSRRLSIAQLADKLVEEIRTATSDGPLIGVTHSLGGILVRHMHARLNWRGLVMLAPPNNGSNVAVKLRNNMLFKAVYGPAGFEVALENEWPCPPQPFGVIAGTKSVSLSNPTSWLTGSLRMFPEGEENDGTLSVSETRHPNMHCFATVDASHTWIMNHPETHKLVLRFLREGAF